MNIVKPVTILYLLFFIALFVWALVGDPKLSGFLQTINEPWNIVVLMDFVFGCLMFSWMIFFVEGSAKATLPWAIALFIVGNIISAVYILLRFNKIRERIGQPAS